MSDVALHFLFALGGGLGAVARHLVTGAVTHRFPLSTLIVNVVGSLALGFGLALLSGQPERFSEQEFRVLVGFCGGFTTFSAFAYQTLDLHRRESLVRALVNILSNLVLCLGAFLLGRLLGGGLT